MANLSNIKIKYFNKNITSIIISEPKTYNALSFKNLNNLIKAFKKLDSDKNIKVIINSRNYGHLKSPFHGILQTNSDACILMVSDFQEPINLIPQYVKKWENGAKIILGEKDTSEENSVMFTLRKLFYTSLNKISETKLSINTTGTGLFDKEVVNRLRKINDPYPYFRGLISEITSEVKLIQFHQPRRAGGNTKNNLYTLYDIGVLGIIKH